MSDIKRYSPEPLYLSGDYTAQMSEEPDGDYVDFDDYERLRAERDAAAKDAERYRWLRKRLEIRLLEAMSGGRRPAMQIRIGCDYFDARTKPGKGYLDPNRFQQECEELDAAIDAARGVPHDPKAYSASLMCPKCGLDRFLQNCPNVSSGDCPMTGQALKARGEK